jgi:hypothetical protein
MRAIQQSTKLHLLTLGVFTAAVFLPMIGKGFIHDDFVHLFSASHDSLLRGLTVAADGPFYAPMTWLTFRFDWHLWGVNPFPMAVENLLLHILNLFLIYAFTLRLWESKVASFWAAFGFGLLLPANTWAIMWISTRAHVLTTTFYLAAMIAMLGFLRTGKLVAAAAVLVLGFLAMFSKESGVTLPAALALLTIYEKRTHPGKSIPVVKFLLLIATVLGVVALYLMLRARSEAVPFSIQDGFYTYSLSLKNLWSNFLEYSWRTYGMLIIVGAALAFSRYLSGARIRFNLLTRNEVAFSILLCAIMISPFMPLPFRSGIYTYLPAVASAVLLGAAVRSFYQSDDGDVPQPRAFAVAPVLLVIATFTVFIVGQSQRWILTAKTTTEVLNQISTQAPTPAPNTYFVLRYSGPDDKNRFPGGLATYAFPSALRLHYGDPSLDGTVVLSDAAYTAPAGSPEVHLAYTTEQNRIRISRLRPN